MVVLGLMGAMATAIDWRGVVLALDARGVAVPEALRDVLSRRGTATGAPGPDVAQAPAVAPPLDTEALTTIIKDWTQANGIQGFTIAIALDGKVIVNAGMGNQPKGSAQLVASLSKAICTNEVLAAHGFTWETKIGDLLTVFDAMRILPGAKAQALTLGQIVTHTGGLKPDLTQGDMAKPTHGGLGMHGRYAWKALKDDALQGTPGEFFYSNTNFAVLGKS